MSLETSLRYLHTFHPASGVLLIGSGNGSLAPLILSLHVKEVILAEADREQIKRMQKVHTLPQEWKIVNAIVYKDTPSCEYHYTNNTSANGIVPVDALKSIFPNLTLKSFELSNAISISTLLKQTKATQVNWLLVDCYTQMPFFEENQTVLESFDVIVARLMKDEKQTLDAWMTEQGFRSVEAYEESNPQVLMVVYLKDFSGRLTLSQKLQKQSQERLNEAEVKYRELKETRESLAQQLDGVTTVKMQLQKKLEDQTTVLEKALAELSTPQASKEEYSKLAQGLKNQLEELQKKSQEEITTLKADVEKFRNWANSLKKQLEEKELEKKQIENEVKSQIENERIKIEAQMDLLKELFNQAEPKDRK